MPELPEVETVVRGLRAHLVGKKILSIDTYRKNLRLPFPANMQKKLAGQTITALSRRAKYILIQVTNGWCLVIHLGMSGRIRTSSEPTREKHDHFQMVLADKTHIILNDARRFGFVLLLTESERLTHPAFRSLGPEPLSPDFSGPVLYQRLKDKKTAIKLALLDQHIVAGIGNIYACEALYESRIHPLRSAGALTAPECDRLVSALQSVLDRAIRAGGSTLKDYRQVSGESGYFQHDFHVYDCEGQKCTACACNILKTGGIQRIVQGGRSTFFCPQVQT
ncbi:MAG: bifunctional DNA-formamidopyrimidine glycosylase/DNA-(apurinic or apyrimidinic site) lyase [Alphaproteobacteria bacterium]|nr:bifunctional DNA-formamidopyrimidine glycosylase/DNA-(apurinic or apyrimidinic site) lyase [Alphaproteobacteria bacterium]